MSLSPSLLDKRRITVIYRQQAQTVSWYPDASPAEIERLIRQVFDVPAHHSILLRDLDGDAVVVSPNLPSNRTFSLTVDDTYLRPSSPYRSSTLSASYSSPSRTSPFRSSSPVLSRSAASPFRSSSPLRSASPRLSPHLTTSPRFAGGASSSSSVFASSGRSLSPSRAASSALAKESLDRIDKLRNFEKHVRELQDNKFREYFTLSPVTGDYIWAKDVTSGEFMSAISTDLYWNAGACGLLSTRRRDEVDRILNGALSAYMDAVRELGRRGNFDLVVSMEAGFAREALRAAYTETINVIQQIIHEKIKEAEIYTRDAY